MCGICGELRFDGQGSDRAAVERMVARLARRGPDGQGLYQQGALALGHRRLAIIDLSAMASQPMVDEALGLAIVFNGTIYNYPELRSELTARGHQFRSHGDTETLLHAWAEWGEAALARLHGMFAFAIWEFASRRLVLVRDRLGIKPLYFSHDGARLRFASTLPALVASGGIDRTLNPLALHHQFTLHGVVPAPFTILNGVSKVAPGQIVIFDSQGGSSSRSWWHLSAERPALARSPREWQAAIHESLARAVRRRLDIADVPVGVLLSGGLDSSLLVGLLAGQGVSDIRTFSIGFEDQPEERGSEFEYSDQVVARFATRHRQYRIANDQVLTRLPEAVGEMAEPMFGQDAVAFYLLAEQVSRDVKVVLSGQGADEVFAGYFWYPQVLRGDGALIDRFTRHYCDRDHAEWLAMIDPRYHTAQDVSRLWLASELAAPGADDDLDRILRLDVQRLIVDDPVKRVDNMTMAWGLEARVPFLDHELVELAMSAPPAMKIGPEGDEAKFVLKQIGRGLIPDAVIDRPKGYFPMPALKYVRGGFLDFMRDIVNSNACQQRGLYQRDYVDRLLAQPDAPEHFTRLQGSKLWHLTLLELWLQQHIDGVVA
jgi:asparagine synthase (glutamine-hydrolysing)